ncbi:Type II secretion system protein E [Tepidanaerobacter acetatoxydans Re1]|uniref:Type II secretion system protein E n=1 Tax=Tepidanaerobacter acetatoxydans (strain DSM 21804 / JCM 16047 / Re1) TaxID=1209989 RepID=F4LW39_TEPAE|nr:CpaF family protein [Tepidanaerobacter acetatoxydans]AEE90815.1 type II secretion system protein E [Tepidanaerobacter acetatoxydans Re1]CCP25372.1 Type II secretion system protein E [Tepidanaerobacter acetatoxydans Re1]
MSGSWLERLEKIKTGDSALSSPVSSEPLKEPAAKIDKFASLREVVHREVIDEYNRQFADGIEHTSDSADIMDIIHRSISRQGQSLTRAEEAKVAQEVFDEVMGLGPLEPLLRDETISEIMVNGANQIYIERAGRLQLTGTRFRDDSHVLKVINRIVSPLGRRCDESNPMVDARLSDGSRINAVIPPIAIHGPSITIRKFSSTPLKIGDLIGFNSLSQAMAHFLEASVKGRCNVVVSGGTGSGKTTLLNVLSGYILDEERIVTIEDVAELQLAQNHVVSLEARPSNIEGKGAVTIRDLVRNALRMRPDRIIVGEVRSAEALDMLQAMNTGHEGSLTTVHANSPRDVISRLETMVMMSGMELPAKAIREQIASAVDLIVHQARFRDGSRKIINISEVIGMEGDMITMQDVFVYHPQGYDDSGRISGKFVATGIVPRVVEKIRNNGTMCKEDWFRKE